MTLFQCSIGSSVPLLSFGVHALETFNRKQYPLSALVVYVAVSVGLCLSSATATTTTTPTATTTTTGTTRITESYDGGQQDVGDEDDTRKLECGEVAVLWREDRKVEHND